MDCRICGKRIWLRDKTSVEVIMSYVVVIHSRCRQGSSPIELRKELSHDEEKPALEQTSQGS